MKLFMMGVEEKSPLVMESITLPCLKILMRLLKPPAPTSKNNKVRHIDYVYMVSVKFLTNPNLVGLDFLFTRNQPNRTKN